MKEQWIFGGYDAVEKKGFLVPVPARDAGTVLPLVQQWVMPGSIIHSDMWQVYNQLGTHGYGPCYRGSHRPCRVYVVEGKEQGQISI